MANSLKLFAIIVIGCASASSAYADNAAPLPTSVVRQTNISTDGARRVLAVARQEAIDRGIDVSLAVVDADGQLIAFERLGKAAPVTIQNAIAKANTAAQLRVPSAVLQKSVDGGLFSYLAIEGVAPLQGGVPISVAGEVVGAIGSSGASSDVDEAIASAGAKAF